MKIKMKMSYVLIQKTAGNLSIVRVYLKKKSAEDEARSLNDLFAKSIPSRVFQVMPVELSEGK